MFVDGHVLMYMGIPSATVHRCYVSLRPFTPSRLKDASEEKRINNKKQMLGLTRDITFMFVLINALNVGKSDWKTERHGELTSENMWFIQSFPAR